MLIKTLQSKTEDHDPLLSVKAPLLLHQFIDVLHFVFH